MMRHAGGPVCWSSQGANCATIPAQVVRSSLVNDKGKEVVMFWYLEAVELPQKPTGMFSARSPLLCHFALQC